MPPKFPPPTVLGEFPPEVVEREPAPAVAPRAPSATRARAPRASRAAQAGTQPEPPVVAAPRARPARNVTWEDEGLEDLPADLGVAPVAAARESVRRQSRAAAPQPPAAAPQPGAAAPRAPPPRQSPEQARAAYSRWLASLPSPSATLLGGSAGPPSAAVWIPEFRAYLSALLAPVYPDARTRADALAGELLRVYMRAMTDISFSADDNEAIEMLGDKILGLAFTQHVHSRVPSAGSRELTNYNTNYMSKRFQAELSAKLKMDQWVLLGAASAARRDAAVTESMKEDLLEAFFSALFAGATQLHQDYLRAGRFEEAALRAVPGLEAARVLIDFIFDGEGLDPKMAEDAARSTLLDITNLFGLRKFGMRFVSPPEGTPNARHSVYISPELQAALAESGYPNVPRELARDFPDKNSAAAAALATLAEHGFGPEEIANQREIANGVRSLFPASFRDEVLRKARALGYPKVLFAIPERSRQPDGTFLVVLIGSDVNDNRVVLASAMGSLFGRVKADVARKFLEAQQ